MSTIQPSALNPPIGCFGGTFNPPHRAHFILAHAAQKNLCLSELRLMPTGQPWQKSHVLPAAQRLEMLKLALIDDEHEHEFWHDEPYPLTIDTTEVDLPQASYTIDTLRTLRERLPNTPIVWVMGSDQLKNLTTWRDWTLLLNYAHIAVAQRAGEEISAEQLPNPLHDYYLAHLTLTDEWRAQLSGYFIPFDCPPFKVSSSAIRNAIASNESIESLADALSPSVSQYITTHHLYKTL